MSRDAAVATGEVVVESKLPELVNAIDGDHRILLMMASIVAFVQRESSPAGTASRRMRSPILSFVRSGMMPDNQGQVPSPRMRNAVSSTTHSIPISGSVLSNGITRSITARTLGLSCIASRSTTRPEYSAGGNVRMSAKSRSSVISARFSTRTVLPMVRSGRPPSY
jgi:hypothetical protein